MPAVSLARFASIIDCPSLRLLPLQPPLGKRPFWPADQSISSRFSACEVKETFGASDAVIMQLDGAYVLMSPENDGLIIDAGGTVWFEPSLFTNACRTHSLYVEMPEREAIHDLPGTHLMTFDGAWKNFYHWTNFAIGKAALMNNLPSQADSFLFPFIDDDFEFKAKWLSSIDRASLGTVTFLKPGLHRIERLLIPWTRPPYPTEIMNFPGLYAALREVAGTTALPAVRKDERRSMDTIYFGRRPDFEQRLDPTLAADLSHMLAARSVRTIFLEELGADDVKHIVENAGTIISPHGAALTNLMYARPGARVIELNRELTGQFRPWYYQVATGYGLEYFCLNADLPPACLAQLGVLLDEEGKVETA